MKHAVFFRIRRAYPHSPDALCAANRGMLADVGRKKIKFSPPFGVITKVDGFCFKQQFLAPKAESQ